MPLHYACEAGVLYKHDPKGQCEIVVSLDLGEGPCLGIFKCKRDGYLILRESWLKLTALSGLIYCCFMILFKNWSCHCLLMEIVSCWQATVKQF